METRHIKITHEDALASKKNLLTSEINLLQTLRKVKNYRILRKKEITSKNKLKTQLTSLKSKLNLIESTFPEPETKIKKSERKERISKKDKERGLDLHNELQEIKSKLARLGG